MLSTMRNIVKVGFVYVGTVVGAGFASGQEIAQFFTRFGPEGIIGIFIACSLFFVIGYSIMASGARIQATSYRDLISVVFGERLARPISLAMGLILLGVTVTMLAGTGALAKEHANLPFTLGVVVTALITLWVVARGMRGIVTANLFIVPCMILFTLILGLSPARPVLHGADASVTPPVASHGLWWLSSLSYAAFNVGLAMPVLVPLGSTIARRRVLLGGAALGSIVLCVMLFVLNQALQASGALAAGYDVPLAAVARATGGWLPVVYLFVLWAEILSTLIGNVYGLSTQWRSRWAISMLAKGCAILLPCALLSYVGFGTLVEYVYPVFGYVSFFLILCILIMGRKGSPLSGS